MLQKDEIVHKVVETVEHRVLHKILDIVQHSHVLEARRGLRDYERIVIMHVLYDFILVMAYQSLDFADEGLLSEEERQVNDVRQAGDGHIEIARVQVEEEESDAGRVAYVAQCRAVLDGRVHYHLRLLLLYLE